MHVRFVNFRQLRRGCRGRRNRRRVVLVAAPAADAAPIVTDCKAFNVNADGSTGTEVANSASQMPLDLGDFTNGVTEVQAGQTYPLGGTPEKFDLPAQITSPAVLAIQEIKNITIEITINGAVLRSAPRR